MEEIVGISGSVSTGSPPFTRRAKKVLELSSREALQLGQSYIGTEHILLGLVREGEGVAAQVLVSLGADLDQVRETVIQLLLSGRTPSPVPESQAGVMQLLRPSQAQLVACSFCGRRPPESGRLVQGRRAFICERCIGEWGQRLAEDESQGREEGPGARLYEAEGDGKESEAGEDEG